MRKLKPQNTYKHLLNFVSKLPSRPILTAVHVTKEGHLEATDSHILLRLLNQVSEGHELVVEPKQLKEMEGTYPDINRLLSTSENAKLSINPDEAIAIVKFLKGFDKNSVIEVSSNNTKLIIKDSGGEMTATFQLHQHNGDDIQFSCNATYLGYMMAFIADCAANLVDIRFTSALRPVVFEVPGQFIGLVTPVRTH